MKSLLVVLAWVAFCQAGSPVVGEVQAAACALAPDGLVAWWKLDGTRQDAAGTNTLTFIGNPTYSPGEAGQGIALSVAPSYAQANAAPSLNVGTKPGFSLEMWIKPSNAAALADLIEWNNLAGGIGVHMSLSTTASADLYANLVDTSETSHQIFTGGGAVTSGVFQHVALTYDRLTGAAFLFLNGTQAAAKNIGVFVPQTSFPFFLGTRPSGVFQGINFVGVMDEVSLYERVLSAAEIQGIFAAGAAGKCGDGTGAVRPAIVSQPSNTMAPQGAAAAFAASAVGTNLTYQWTRNGLPIAGATQSNLIFQAVQAADAGVYGVIVTNAVGVVTSAPAFLTVLPAGATLLITEFSSGTANSLRDVDGETPDWIEIYNAASAPLSLLDWALTDTRQNLVKWRFPSVALPGRAAMIVFASGKDRRMAGAELHANFRLDQNGGYLALVQADGATIASEFNYERQRITYSFGWGDAARMLFFPAPTPGAGNNAGLDGFVSDTSFAPDRGFYFSAFDVVIRCPTPGATIIYTTNASEPSPTNASAVQVSAVDENTPATATVRVSTTTTLRAAGFKTGLGSTDVDTHTYIFPTRVASQAAPPGAATQWIDDGEGGSFQPDFVVNASVVGSAQPPYSFTNALLALPTMSLVGPVEDIFGPEGIYTHPVREGPEQERRTSVELFYPNNQTGFQVDAGLRIHGAVSRHHHAILKHPFRLAFRSEYGTAMLRYALFPDSSVDEFDQLVLRACSTDSFAILAGIGFGATGCGGKLWLDGEATYQRDQWMRDTQLATGQASAHGIYVNLYVNGRFWGLYNVTERLGDAFAASYFGGQKEEYDVITYDYVPNPSGAHVVAAGSDAIWNQMLQVASQIQGNPNKYWEIQGLNATGTRNPSLPVLVDVDNLIDYFIVHIYAAAIEWPNRNWWAARRRDTSPAQRDSTGFKFLVWDQEIALDRLGCEWTWANNSHFELVTQADTPAQVYAGLRSHPEFRLRFADHLQRHLYHGGVLTLAANRARWQMRADEIDYAIVGESARWGDRAGPFVHTPPYTRANWLNRLSWTQNTFFPGNELAARARFANAGLFPALRAPEFSQDGGNVPAGFALTLSHPNPSGVIYYTTDGTDPRQIGGGVGLAAAPYSAPVPIVFPRNVRARVKNGSDWSPLVEAFFNPPQDLSGLALTEIMYNPPNGSTYPADGEFLEFKNTGTNRIDLSGMRMIGVAAPDGTGRDFTFASETALAPGAFLVLVRAVDEAAFAAQHPGVAIGGRFGGALDNRGERLMLLDGAGGPVFSVEYGDAAPWPAACDGHGFSLVQVTGGDTPAPDDATKWRASAAVGGSPGADDPAPGASVPPIVINEVLSASPLVSTGDRIELFNPTESPVDVGGWFLTDDRGRPAKYVIPSPTTIEPGGWVSFDEAQFNAGPGAFALDSNGDQIYLFSADSQGRLTGHSHGFSFGAEDPDVSFGRYVNTAGVESFPAQVSQSFGAGNVGPRVGPIVINEIHYHPSGTNDEFVELKNISGTNVALFDPSFPNRVWRVAGIDYVFPTNLHLAANARLLVVPISPSVFASRYAVPAGVGVFGPYLGELQDSGETLSLQRPSADGTAWVAVDEVRYNDKEPWPAEADGGGASLQRVNSARYGNEPANWLAAPPTPGRSNAAPDVDLQFASVEFLRGGIGDQVRLGFHPSGLSSYAVQWSDRLPDGEWHPLQTVDGSGGEPLAFIVDPLPAGISARFYRVILLPGDP